MAAKQEILHNDDLTESMGLLISLLVRYPELASVSFDLDCQQLKFTFIFAEPLEGQQMSDFLTLLRNSLLTFNYLEKNDMKMLNMKYDLNDKVTVLEVCRDAETITAGEIAMLVALVQEQFAQDIVVEQNGYLLEEDMLLQEAMIDKLLQISRENVQPKQLIAFREEGKVLVYDK